MLMTKVLLEKFEALTVSRK